MLNYKEICRVMKSNLEHVKLKYFTKEFYETFCEAWKTKDWTPVFSTDFYIKEGFSYCVFLEVFSASLPKWKLSFAKLDHGYPISLGHTYIHEDTEDAARTLGLEMLKSYQGADHLDVTKVS